MVRGRGEDSILRMRRVHDYGRPDAPDDYGPSQAFARERREAGADGVVYPSVRHAPGQCIAAFYPDVVGVPAQGDHFRYCWDANAGDGGRITYARKITGDQSILML